MDKVIVANGQGGKVTQYLTGHAGAILAYEMGLISGILLALLVLRLLAGA